MRAQACTHTHISTPTSPPTPPKHPLQRRRPPAVVVHDGDLAHAGGPRLSGRVGHGQLGELQHLAGVWSQERVLRCCGLGALAGLWGNTQASSCGALPAGCPTLKSPCKSCCSAWSTHGGAAQTAQRLRAHLGHRCAVHEIVGFFHQTLYVQPARQEADTKGVKGFRVRGRHACVWVHRVQHGQGFLMGSSESLSGAGRTTSACHSRPCRPPTGRHNWRGAAPWAHRTHRAPAAMPGWRSSAPRPPGNKEARGGVHCGLACVCRTERIGVQHPRTTALHSHPCLLGNERCAPGAGLSPAVSSSAAAFYPKLLPSLRVLPSPSRPQGATYLAVQRDGGQLHKGGVVPGVGQLHLTRGRGSGRV